MRSAWWGVLSPYHLDAVLAAMNLHAGDPDAGMYRPTPAHVRKHLERTIPGMIADRRGAIIRDARLRMAMHEEHIARLQTDVKLMLLTEEEAAPKIELEARKIRAIRHEPDVRRALQPLRIREDEPDVAPMDRLPDVVRKAIGWPESPRRCRP